MRHTLEVRWPNVVRIEPVFDAEFPIGSTRNMRTWYTTKICHPTVRSQISHMVADSAWVEGVNTKGGFGVWCCDVAYEMAKIQDILQRHGALTLALSHE